MADSQYKQLKAELVLITQEIGQAEKAIKTYKGIAEDPDQSSSERAKARAAYNKAVQRLKDSKKKYADKEKAAEKILGETAVEQVKAKYDKLKERLDLQLDPNSAAAQKLKSQVNELIPEMQRALKQTTGTNISPTVAKSRLTGGKIPTLASAEGTGVASVGTPVSGTPAKKTTASSTANKPASVKDTTPSTPATPAKPSTPAAKPKAPTSAEKEIAAEKIATEADFGLSEALFKNIPSLKAIFDRYTDPKSGMTDDEFRKLIRNDTWYKQNSKEIKNRFVQYYNYQDLKNSGQAKGATDYEKQITTIESNLKKRAAAMGSAAASDPAALRKAAENLYLTDRSEDDSFITDFLAQAIRPVAGQIGGKTTEGYSGDALRNYTALLQTARDNGFEISDILPGGANEQQVLAGIASGTIDIGRVAQDARKLAAQGQPQYVRDLLAQGYNLAQVFAPYRQTMATVLDIQDPNQIDLNDPLLRTAITDKGDMNLYDFKKALRQDSRWQYTEQAKKDVSDAALTVLRDFGFQG